MNKDNHSSLCSESESFYFDFASKAQLHSIPKNIIEHIKNCAYCQKQIDRIQNSFYSKGVDFTGNYSQYGEYLSLRIGDIHIPNVKNQEPLKIECQQFIDSILTNTPPISDGRDGLKVVKVLSAAQESLKKGGVPVKIN